MRTLVREENFHSASVLDVSAAIQVLLGQVAHPNSTVMLTFGESLAAACLATGASFVATVVEVLTAPASVAISPLFERSSRCEPRKAGRSPSEPSKGSTGLYCGCKRFCQCFKSGLVTLSKFYQVDRDLRTRLYASISYNLDNRKNVHLRQLRYCLGDCSCRQILASRSCAFSR